MFVKRFLVSLIVLCVAALASVSTALASPTALSLAQQAAAAYWHAKPCGGQVAIRYAPATAMPTNDTGGIGTGPGPLSAWTGWIGPLADETDCVVTWNEGEFSPARQAHRFPVFCALMVHEYGHFFGNEDTETDPDSINYPLITARNMGVAPCRARYLDAVGMLLIPQPRAPTDSPAVIRIRSQRRSVRYPAGR